MPDIRSRINPALTLSYIMDGDENKWFDRKSAKIKPSDLAQIISAFANAEGGTIVLGIDEKTREIEGIDSAGSEKINAFISAPKDCCKPMPSYQDERLEVKNRKGKVDHLLLLHIFPNPDQVIRTANDSTYLRIGDKTKEIKGEDLRNLEYNKGLRHYEDECNRDASISDLDEDLLRFYREKIQAEALSSEEVLSARGFIKRQRDGKYLTNAAVLLFARNVQQFYPNCRIRFVRYDGTFAKTGTEMNIVRDYNIEQPLLRIIDKARDFISAQLREFVALNPETGRFQSVPEYPEFAWLEGIVNAVTHREYALMGSYIKVSMYDDRLEIESPGRLPNIVTIENIKDTRYSRNPKIARVLSECGWVKELNEGVKRIYSDMKKFFLDDPEYSEPGQAVRLVLKNNIVMRNLRKSDRALDSVGEQTWNQLDEVDRQILTYMSGKVAVTRVELQEYLSRSGVYISNRLRNLTALGAVKAHGLRNDPKRTYSLAQNDSSQ